MTDSHVIARKFRPQSFDQVIGQEPITRTLVNALKSNRVHHAYLFTGARGVGKTTTARILAKSLNCETGITSTPCDACSSCVEIAASRSIDVLEIDAASNTGVDNVREVIINSITIAPARDRHKIFIIDEVHMLSTQAFNALLKTLEEPPPRVVFVLATTNLEKVPETILSRCQVFEFRTIGLKKMILELRRIAEAEKIEISDVALMAIARAGEGSMRDAESALDQVISFAGNVVADDAVPAALGLVDIETLNQTLQAIADQDAARLVRIVDEVVSRGYDLRNFCRELMVHIRALLVVKITDFDSELVQLPESEAETLNSLSEAFSEQDLLRFFSILTKTEQDIRLSSQPRFQLEIGLVKLAQARRLYLLEEAIDRIQALESRLGGSSASADRAPAASRASRPAVTQPAHSPSARSISTTVKSTGGQTSPKPESRAQVAATPAPGAAVATATSPGSAVRAEASLPPEPPPFAEEQYEVDPTPLPTVRTPSGDARVARIKAALEAKRKMMIVTALDKGDISIDGDHLRVSYSLENGACKKEIEARDKRIAIEDACEEVLGRRLTLWASVAGQPESGATPIPASKVKQAAEENPKLRALVEKFRGEIIEVTKPED